MTALSVNVNKIAVLRNSRGGSEPDVCLAATTAIRAGCQGITVHPRPDARHIRFSDVLALRDLLPNAVELNIEGNPFAGPRPGYPGLLEIVAQARPQQVTLVPDGDQQLTSDHGFDPIADSDRLTEVLAALKALGTRVSVFVDTSATGFGRFRDIGIDRVELYTGRYAAAHAAGSGEAGIQAYARVAEDARKAGLGVNAGHDLSQANLGDFLRAAAPVDEVSIGHALIGEALYEGIDRTVKRYLAIIAAAGAA
ncbi:MAG: pyridoxine 5'-phosphate synthase [Lysobacterales bacterium CG17_big_fil_post_rev_8_21_14_2_50_64_11]|nr:MAG: pyridoxine 5'-phosphate synthase [Xanthomonadales bacterium CG17_big_fil_post_rev_8_21_14_2_50_64_11]PIX60697.1 MAG: pyridoxine 5'-phosphate synthase [Xanthomonadales bacterium CG_4_10_14_3_um_filter_64_11]